MKILAFPIAVKGKSLRQLLPLAVVIAVLGVGGYFIAKNWQFLPKILTKLPAGVFVLIIKTKSRQARNLLSRDLLWVILKSRRKNKENMLKVQKKERE